MTAEPSAVEAVPPVSGGSHRGGAVEVHSVDWIPTGERHGKPFHLGAFWFVANVNLTSIATGVAAIAVGGSLFWTALATILGALFGTAFMAAHSSQGPHLGLPQLLQSRPQFGYVGAAVTVWVFALINYVAYNVSDALLASQALHLVTGAPHGLGYLIAGGTATIVAILGYRTIHRLSRWLAIPLIVITAFITLAVFLNGDVTLDALRPGPFDGASFATVFVIVTGFQLGWAPYVSDYSRYMSPQTSARTVIAWTYCSSLAAGVWVFLLGSMLGAASPGADPVTAMSAASDRFVPHSGGFIVAAFLLGLLSVMAVNQYGGSLTLISIIDSFRSVTPRRAIRVWTVLVVFAAVWSISQLVGADRFNTFYGNVLIFLAYLFTPWTAINLVDYFLVRRGNYVIAEIFRPNGIYGRWGWRGITAYCVGLAAMVPFMVTAPYTGPVATALHGVDYSIFVGLAVASVVYFLLCRSLDLDGERVLAQREGKVELSWPARAGHQDTA